MRFYPYLYLLPALLFVACSPTKKLVETPDFILSDQDKHEIIREIPNYENSLTAIEGKGRAIVSEPGNSERVTIDFASDSSKSLLTIKNRIGIEGGAMLVEGDSILIYYKLDKIAQKVSIFDGRLTSLNELASINLLDLLNYKVHAEEVLEVYESEQDYLLRLQTNGGVTVNKGSNTVSNVRQPRSAGLPYSMIEYENYGELNSYILPRKITILSADGSSKVIFQIRTLDIHPGELTLHLEIPENITIERL